ncbi:MAG: chemotaxis protein CheR [Spirochaeta sp.]|jgi:chemotaxis protein methyltransferase CheR|nr:chemotaxis protein CheR [Spirochaeta sp.]
MAGITLKEAHFRRLSSFIESEVGIKMPPAKRIMLESRLQKRLRALNFETFDAYIEHVFNADNSEIIHMIDVVTTNKTDFFREPDHFVYLRERLLPEHVERDRWGLDGRFKIWSAASSTGEEAYTLAIVLAEYQRQENPRFDFRILGTDISTAVLETARRAVYPADRVAPVSTEFRKRYLLRSRNHDTETVRVKRALREKAQFHRLNLMVPRFPIRDRFHVIFCRNVIIYFDRERQEQLLRKLYDYLVPGGYLFLGHSETLAGIDLPVVSVAPTVYQRVEEAH